MDRDSRLKRFVLVALGLLIVVGIAWAFGWFLPPRPTTNLLFITLDTTRADRLGCYGYSDAATPTLDRLAATGVRFDRAYSPAPLTLPAHASLFTGLYPPEHGLRTNGRGRLAETLPTLPALLQQVGYDTAAFVSSFVLDHRFGLGRGWGKYDDGQLARTPSELDALQRQRGARQVADAALDWFQHRDSKPFCLRASARGSRGDRGSAARPPHGVVRRTPRRRASSFEDDLHAVVGDLPARVLDREALLRARREDGVRVVDVRVDPACA